MTRVMKNGETKGVRCGRRRERT